MRSAAAWWRRLPMPLEQKDFADGSASLPATMADIFLALVGVVIIMLLSLIPAIRTPGGLEMLTPFEVWRSDIRFDGTRSEIVVAEEDGLRVPGDRERLVELDMILEDQDLARRLSTASEEGENILMVVLPEGQEAAFLLEALAGQLDLEALHHLRIDHACGYLRDQQLARICRGRPLRGEGS